MQSAKLKKNLSFVSNILKNLLFEQKPFHIEKIPPLMLVPILNLIH